MTIFSPGFSSAEQTNFRRRLKFLPHSLSFDIFGPDPEPSARPWELELTLGVTSFIGLLLFLTDFILKKR